MEGRRQEVDGEKDWDERPFYMARTIVKGPTSRLGNTSLWNAALTINCRNTASAGRHTRLSVTSIIK